MLLIVSGCETTPGSSIPTVPGEEHQEFWNFADAENLVERAFRTTAPSKANLLYLEAARIFLALGDSNKASRIVARIQPDHLDSRTDFQYRLFQIELLMESSRLNEALLESRALTPRNETDRTQLLLMQARLEEGLGRFKEAANTLISLPPSPENQQAINDKIWQYINLAANETPSLNSEHSQGFRDARQLSNERAWWQLSQALQEGFDPSEQRYILKNWMKMHRDHPATRFLPSSLVQLLSAPEKGKQVALMLPLSGPLGNAGRIVRDGYIAGYLHHPPGTVTTRSNSVSISVFDTYGQDMGALYEQAVHAGAEVIVGPLSKAHVSDLSQVVRRDIPVLALNTLSPGTPSPDDFLQLSLAIEDEAQALAEKLQQQQVKNIAVIYGPDAWALRGNQAFTQFWSNRGSINLTSAGFEDPRKITQTVGDLFAVGDSMARHESLNRLTGLDSEMVPRSRQDIQALVALVNGRQMRALKPALAFHFVRGTPIYTSSQVLQDLNPQAYSSLEGIYLCEIPWLVTNSTLRRDIESAFPGYNNRLAPLYAMGIDAYRLVARMELFTLSADDHILGGTGMLSLGAGGRIERKLVWATIRQGKLEPLDQ